MKKKVGNINRKFYPVAMLPTAVLGVGLGIAVPVAHATILLPDEVIVTARRTEEAVQTVPISMTVFNQEMLDERNIVSGADLAAFTPSLAVNTRFGADNTTFAIRGFTQELRTTSSVAVYFADVVAPRGNGSISAGDGAGPGAFFDLQNVQVLKGPQGTLFGRNTTGGAILLVPQEPTNKLEGYLEQSAGNYSMRRTQGVINVPITDRVRARLGFDTEKRDGYLDNVSGIGPDRLANVNYVAARGTVAWDITDEVKNSTIYSYTNSNNNGSIQGLFACKPGHPFGAFCNPALQNLGTGFYNVANEQPDPESSLKQWQVINTTTWEVNDNFTVKNNLSYANLLQTTRTSNFGANARMPAGSGPFTNAHLWLFPAATWQGIPSTNQNTYVEELQLSGTALDTKLTWQSGLYYERSRPEELTGALSPSMTVCNPSSGDPSGWNCPITLPGGGVVSSLTSLEYINKAVYAQGTYDISDEFRVTVGARYTDDETNGDSQQTSYAFAPFTGQLTGSNCVLTGANPANDCSLKSSQHSEAPTWMIDFDYLPTPDVMVYTKWTRGYRQGSVSPASPGGLQTFDPEKVDAYEIGAKTTFQGPVPGTFNVALFYNDLTDQQVQVGEVPCGLGSGTCTPAPPGFAGSATTAIVNAGSSTIQGVEVETTLKLLDDLVYNLSYTYLSTRLDSLAPQVGAPGYSATLAAEEGGHLSFSPTHSLTTGLSYHLPVPTEWGEMSAGATYTFVSDQISSVDTLGTLPARQLLNLNAGWKAIMGSAFDASLFVTNALNEEYATYNPGVYDSLGMGFQVVGEPKMMGARVKYNFK
jgi:iron complex outermembrane receptor protein